MNRPALCKYFFCFLLLLFSFSLFLLFLLFFYPFFALSLGRLLQESWTDFKSQERERKTKLACNAPDVTFHICIQLLPFPVSSYICFSGSGPCLRVLFSFSCISYHVITCIAFAYMFISCIRSFSPLSVLHSGASFSSGGHF